MIEDFSPVLSAKCMKIIECDTARISKYDKLFLIIGFNKNTKDDPGQWVDENGNKKDWDYVQEKVVANGETEEELIKSAEEYQRLCEIWDHSNPSIERMDSPFSGQIFNIIKQ